MAQEGARGAKKLGKEGQDCLRSEAVLAHSLDGPAFLAWFEKRDFPEPHVPGKG